MAVGLSPALAQEILDALGNAVAPTILPVTAFWIQLHIADPGAAGTANPAVNATRKQVSYAAASAGTMSSDADVLWSAGEVTTTETYTHWSAHTLNAAGTFLCSGTVTNGAVTAGNEFRLPTGDIDQVLPNVAA